MKKVKEIIFGISFLVGLGVIFFPLSYHHDHHPLLAKDLPEVDFKNSVNALEPPGILSKLQSISSDELSYLANESMNQKLQEMKSYLIEIEHLKTKEEAKSLVNELQKAGYPAFMTRFRSSDNAYHIAIGPHLNKEEALKLKTILESKFNLKGNVVDYVPTDIMKENA